MCKFKSNAETRYFCAFPSSDSRRRACDLGVISVPERGLAPSGVVEHVRPDAIDASSLWQILLDGVEGEAAVWPSRVRRGAARRSSGPMRDDQRRARIERPGSCAPLADRPPRDSRLCDAAAAPLVGAGPASEPRAVYGRLAGHRRRPSAPAPAQKTGLPKRKPTLPLTPREVSLSHAHLCRRKTGAQTRRHRNA